MAMTENQMHDIISTALIKACEDDGFKQELLASPINAIEKLTGERLQFKTQRTTSATDMLAVECLAQNNTYEVVTVEGELSEAELELVAGGQINHYRSLKEFKAFLHVYL